MPEYIERKETVSEMLEAMCGTGYQQWAIDVINRQPAADVVEVVRCKDCKHFGKNKIYRQNPKLPFSFCEKFHHNITTENDYCSYGERVVKNG